MIDDPSVFQYDEVYDEIVQKRDEQTHWQKRTTDKKVSYIIIKLKDKYSVPNNRLDKYTST